AHTTRLGLELAPPRSGRAPVAHAHPSRLWGDPLPSPLRGGAGGGVSGRAAMVHVTARSPTRERLRPKKQEALHRTKLIIACRTLVEVRRTKKTWSLHAERATDRRDQRLPRSGSRD